MGLEALGVDAQRHVHGAALQQVQPRLEATQAGKPIPIKKLLVVEHCNQADQKTVSR